MKPACRSRRGGRRLFTAAVLLASFSSIGFACGFPDVRFGDIDDIDGTSSEAGASDVHARSDAPSNFDAPGDEVEAGVRQDGQAKVDPDAACPGTNPCDCDNDGYQAEGDACAGNDCDDRDPLVHPNQIYIADPPEPPNEGNWDCTDPIEKQYLFNLNCSLLGGSGEGFRDDPGCGAMSDYYRCTGFLFGSEKIGTRRQGCR